MSTAVLYLPYLPAVTWWIESLVHENILLDQEENFIKATSRNRCEIAGANGKILLTIPIEGGRERRQKYREVKISNKTDWQHIHWQSICSAYGKTPFFEFYAHRLHPFYHSRFEFLFEFNLQLLKLILGILQIRKEIMMTISYVKMPDLVKDIRSKTNVIMLPRYYQIFEERNGFINNLSILDLLFHQGPEAKQYLLNASKLQGEEAINKN